MKITPLVEIYANSAQIVENFKNWTLYSKMCKEKEVIDVQVSLILLPMFVERPCTHFCTKFPPPGSARYYKRLSSFDFVSKSKVCTFPKGIGLKGKREMSFICPWLELV